MIMIEQPHRIVLRCAILFALPLLGAAATMTAAQIYVSHDDAVCHLSNIVRSTPTLSGRSIAASYYLAVANTMLVLVCAAALIITVRWMVLSSSAYFSDQVSRYLWGVIVLSLAIASLSFVIPGAVDDNVARTLFAFTYQRAVGVVPSVWCHYQMGPDDDISLSGLQLGWDARWLGFLVFSSYLISAAIAAFVAGSWPAPRPQQQADERLSVLNAILFSMAAILVVATITAKSRFELGLATLNPGTPGYAEYQVTGNAIASYMAAVQTIFLALLYLPSAMLLSPSTLIAQLNEANLGRLAKLLAIFSPPIVTKLIDVFASTPG
jgi:hypothetical protein